MDFPSWSPHLEKKSKTNYNFCHIGLGLAIKKKPYTVFPITISKRVEFRMIRIALNNRLAYMYPKANFFLELSFYNLIWIPQFLSLFSREKFKGFLIFAFRSSTVYISKKWWHLNRLQESTRERFHCSF